MTGDKVAKQLERDAVAYKAGFADGYRAAKSEQILCKDCKHWYCYGDETFCSELGIDGTNKESYCSYAKRKRK